VSVERLGDGLDGQGSICAPTHCGAIEILSSMVPVLHVLPKLRRNHVLFFAVLGFLLLGAVWPGGPGTTPRVDFRMMSERRPAGRLNNLSHGRGRDIRFNVWCLLCVPTGVCFDNVALPPKLKLRNPPSEFPTGSSTNNYYGNPVFRHLGILGGVGPCAAAAGPMAAAGPLAALAAPATIVTVARVSGRAPAPVAAPVAASVAAPPEKNI
jgi:hypothetical protein